MPRRPSNPEAEASHAHPDRRGAGARHRAEGADPRNSARTWPSTAWRCTARWRRRKSPSRAAWPACCWSRAPSRCASRRWMPSASSTPRASSPAISRPSRRSSSSASPGPATARWAREARPDNFRALRVVRAVAVTPRMRRITLRGEDLARFCTDAQWHVKILIPDPALPATGHPAGARGSASPTDRAFLSGQAFPVTPPKAPIGTPGPAAPGLAAPDLATPGLAATAAADYRRRSCAACCCWPPWPAALAFAFLLDLATGPARLPLADGHRRAARRARRRRADGRHPLGGPPALRGHGGAGRRSPGPRRGRDADRARQPAGQPLHARRLLRGLARRGAGDRAAAWAARPAGRTGWSRPTPSSSPSARWPLLQLLARLRGRGRNPWSCSASRWSSPSTR